MASARSGRKAQPWPTPWDRLVIRVTGLPGVTIPWANQLDPTRGPKKSLARTITAGASADALRSRSSIFARIAPLRDQGRWGLPSRITGVVAGAKL